MDRVLAAAGIPLHRFQARRSYSLEQLRADLQQGCRIRPAENRAATKAPPAVPVGV